MAHIRGPGPPNVRGTGVPPLTRPDSPGAPLQCTADSSGPAGAHGERKQHHQLCLGHLQDARERSKGTTEGQGETASTCPMGRSMQHEDGTPPPCLGEGCPRHKPGKVSRRCPLHQRDHMHDTEVGPGSAPLLPFHAPPSDGEERRGPAGRARRAVTFTKECPSLG